GQYGASGFTTLAGQRGAAGFATLGGQYGASGFTTLAGQRGAAGFATLGGQYGASGFAVATVMESSSAVSVLEMPRTTRVRTSCSRSVTSPSPGR
ncbi:hypothetical protein, partial [Nonomuraea sp. NPDC003709]|uniref:hypothetical protein n=1 Tax=Nonomuraea sp. NPDC003709 TaxID=3154450 RepID=UPI0033B8F7A7